MKRISVPNAEKVDCEGFTLVEVMLAVAIFAIGILAIASMQIGATNANSSAYRLTERISLAEARIESLLSLPYGHPDLAQGNHQDPRPPAGYVITWNVVDNAPVANSKTLSVSSSYQGRDGVARIITLTYVKPSI